MADITTRALSVAARDGTRLVHPVDITLFAGELLAIVGPNGAGKSSLMRALAGVAPYTGSAQVDGDEIAALRPLERARRIAWLPQSLPPAWPVQVADAVALGRFAYGAVPTQLGTEDRYAVVQAMRDCDLDRLSQRRIDSLSGGELARVHLARMMATEAAVMLADEPAAALDLAHRLTMMQQFARMAAQGRLVAVIVHDLALAARWAQRMLVLSGGHVVADGAPADILTPALLANVFQVEAVVSQSSGRPIIDIRRPVTEGAAAATD